MNQLYKINVNKELSHMLAKESFLVAQTGDFLIEKQLVDESPRGYYITKRGRDVVIAYLRRYKEIAEGKNSGDTK